MKHFIGIIVEMYDGRETTNKVVVSASTEKAAQTKISKTAETWLDKDEDEIEVSKAYIQKEIPAEHAEILKQYL